ncbi:hypothetical protein [Paraburkholderia solisilvae]|uniref:Uncharacterized protein n=1 Tax=Paraburkholderia solisilvae TaxID=624376 RepID=A0A6J5CXV8_9BURK|nr:hypothetical protein [Paraburkholderia solisilvae]CAB3746423.1 hypothetical protein LMG29739_00180 [Paraburkholderia solisilvae]
MPPIHATGGRVHIETQSPHPVEPQVPPPETRPSSADRFNAGKPVSPQQGTTAGSRSQIRGRGASGAHQTGSTPPLPDAYIGQPQGDLRADPRHAGIVIDASGQPYVALDNRYYAVRNDPTNGTWRAVQLQDPAKPGIPIRQDRSGNWQPDAGVGLPGGSPNDSHVMMMRQDLERRRDELNRELVSLTHAERDALMLVERFDSVARFFDGQLNALRAHGSDDRNAMAQVAQVHADVAQAQNTLRQVRNEQYAKVGVLRDVEQQLSRLPRTAM